MSELTALLMMGLLRGPWGRSAR